MSRATRRPSNQSEKERKQKKALLALSPVLLLLLVWQGPKTLGALSGSGEATPPPAPPAAAASSTQANPPATETGPSATETETTSSLPESDEAPSADPGQLVSFTRFVGKDPFRQQVGQPTTSASEESAPAESATEGSAPDEAADVGGGGAGDDGGDEFAVLTVNGERTRVPVGGAFPADDRIFTLVDLEGETARIGLVNGKLSTGKRAVAVAPGERVVLENEANGMRYVIRLVRVPGA